MNLNLEIKAHRILRVELLKVQFDQSRKQSKGILIEAEPVKVNDGRSDCGYDYVEDFEKLLSI
jgi:hypothetical protein